MIEQVHVERLTKRNSLALGYTVVNTTCIIYLHELQWHVLLFRDQLRPEVISVYHNLLRIVECLGQDAIFV